MRKLALLGLITLFTAQVFAEDGSTTGMGATRRDEAEIGAYVARNKGFQDREIFKPFGMFRMEYKYYGSVEGEHSGDGIDNWAGSEAGQARLETRLLATLAPKHRIDVRTQKFVSSKSSKKGPGEYHWDHQNGGMAFEPITTSDEVRIRYQYHLGNLGNTEAQHMLRAEYKRRNRFDTNKFAFMWVIDFAKMFPQNDFIKVNYFEVKPIYERWMHKDERRPYNEHWFGFDLETQFQLPKGFQLEFNFINRYMKFNKNVVYTANGAYDNRFQSLFELYLRNVTPLYKKGNLGIDFVFDGGIDPYLMTNRKFMKVAQEDYYINTPNGAIKVLDAGTPLAQAGTPQRRAYFIYAEPAIQVTYKPTTDVQIYGAIGAAYGNFGHQTSKNAKDWRWQPRAWAGVRIFF